MSDRIQKPKTQRGKRALLKREPKVIENTKQALLLRGATASDKAMKFIKDVHALKKMHSTYFGEKHPLNPFEDPTPLEEFARKYDTALFGFCSHNKKRPNNVIFGRLYDYHMLDMIEFGLEQFQPLAEFKGSKVSLGVKPLLIFTGDLWHQNDEYGRCKSLLIDFFRGEMVEQVRLGGFEHALCFTAADGKVFFRSYKIVTQKSGTKTPRVELLEIGPSADLVLRRTKLASADLFKTACRVPVQAKPKKTKNISKNALGTKLGRIHMPRQDFKKLQVKRGRALRPERKTSKKVRAKDGAAGGTSPAAAE